MKQKKILRILQLVLLMTVLIGCNTLKKEENQEQPTKIKIVVPDYDYPDIPVLPYAVRYWSEDTPIEADYWIVPGSYLKALDVYFEQMAELELEYNIDKEMYNGSY